VDSVVLHGLVGSTDYKLRAHFELSVGIMVVTIFRTWLFQTLCACLHCVTSRNNV